MAEIIVTGEMEKEHLTYWENKICPKLTKNSVEAKVNEHLDALNFPNDSYKSAYKTYTEVISILEDRWEKFAIGNVEELRQLHGIISRIEENIKNWDQYSKFMVNLLGYKNFSEIRYGNNDIQVFNADHDKPIWSPYTLIKMSKVRNCPYCNRQFITPLYTSQGRMRPDLDHFWPKSIYPCFTMSLYNLVPVCKFCNSSLKGIKDFSIGSANPFTHSFDELFIFDLDIISDTKEPKINLIGVKEDATRFIDGMLIKEQYNIHQDVAFELVKKAQMYPKEFFHKIHSSNDIEIKDEELFKEHLFGYIRDDMERKNTPLGKLKTDIAEKLGLFKRK